MCGDYLSVLVLPCCLFTCMSPLVVCLPQVFFGSHLVSTMACWRVGQSPVGVRVALTFKRDTCR